MYSGIQTHSPGGVKRQASEGQGDPSFLQALAIPLSSGLPSKAAPGSSWSGPRAVVHRVPKGSSPWRYAFEVEGWQAQGEAGHVQSGVCVPPGSYLLLLGDPLHSPQGVWVAHVAGQGLHQRVSNVCQGKLCLSKSPAWAGTPRLMPTWPQLRQNTACQTCHSTPTPRAKGPLDTPYQCLRCVGQQSVWQGWQPSGLGSPHSLQERAVRLLARSKGFRGMSFGQGGQVCVTGLELTLGACLDPCLHLSKAI